MPVLLVIVRLISRAGTRGQRVSAPLCRALAPSLVRNRELRDWERQPRG
jgi:hypothetical protein